MIYFFLGSVCTSFVILAYCKYNLRKLKAEIPPPIAALEEKKPLTEEEARKELERALKEMFGPDMGISFEGFDEGGQVVPFTEIENYNDAKKELLHHKEMYKMLTDEDLIEELLSYTQKGYEFDGLMELHDKLLKRSDLSGDERKKLEQWYVLVGMELVYNV